MKTLKMDLALIDSATGNQLGSGRQARAFFDARGFANRKPQQSNIGDCALWHALVRAVRESGNQELAAKLRDCGEII